MRQLPTLQAAQLGGFVDAFEERIVVAYEVDEETLGCLLPPLILQPLVENALKHGLEPKPGGGAVAIAIAREESALVLEVRDDGLGLDPHRPAGVGLTNVRQRIEALSAGKGSLLLRPLAEGGLCARVVLPFPAAAPAAQASA